MAATRTSSPNTDPHSLKALLDGPDPFWQTSTIRGEAPERMSIMETMGGKKARPRRSFSKAFKAEVVELVRTSGKTVPEVCRDLDLTETAVRAWVGQADNDDGQRGELTTTEREVLARCRKENRVLREERDIVKRATAFFASEAR